jgi:spore germination protein YaaH
VEAIVTEATRVYADLGASPYQGVTIDFEGLAGSANKANFTAFLTALSQQLRAKGLGLNVAVMPATADGSYYNGYDYRAIGNLADKVILMAHDYQPASLSQFIGTTYYKNAALTPFQSVYYSLRVATDPDTGVSDPSKLALAISCTANAWQVDSAGKLTAATPLLPTSATVAARLQGGATMGWSDTYRNPYLTYTTESGQNIFLWYEDSRSVAAKVQLAKLFGVTSVSLWRLGNLPNLSGDSYYYNILSACS